MIVKYLRQYHKASRQDLDTLLLDKLSDVLDDAQKRNKVRNLVQAMANAGIVRNAGSRRYPQWVLVLEKKDEN